MAVRLARAARPLEGSPSAPPRAKLEPMTISEADLIHLRRAVELAREALEGGDGPFGSVLVDRAGVERFADRNREESTGDPTRHPEFEIARWSAEHPTSSVARRAVPERRRGARRMTAILGRRHADPTCGATEFGHHPHMVSLAGPEAAQSVSGARGNPVRIRDCPAAVSGNDRRHQALLAPCGWEATASRNRVGD